MLDRALARHADAPLFGTKHEGGWHWMNYRSFGAEVDAYRAHLTAAGVGHGDRVALISDNRPEWAAVAFACFGVGAALVPMYEAQGARDWRHITADCGAKLLVCAGDEIFARCATFPAEIDGLEQRLGIALGAGHADDLATARGDAVAAIAPSGDDTACIIYTSGTTGDPKGVTLSHKNLCANVDMMLDVVSLASSDRSVSFLPWAHAFGQTCELYAMMALGCSMALSPSVAKLAADLVDIQPTVLVSVPRLFTRFVADLQRQMAARPALMRKTYETGLTLLRERRHRKLGLAERLALEAAERLIFSAVRARFGGKLRFAFSGGASLPLEVAQLLADLGIPVYEGYGLTECAPVVSANRPGAWRVGSVGKPLPGVRVTIDNFDTEDPDDGEIIVYGANVMTGYHGRPEETARVMTDDGGLRTGDIGRVDSSGFLYITGRLEEQYKLSNGKHVVPAVLEEGLRMSPYLANVMIYGDGRDHNVALVVVDLDAIHRWADERKLSFRNTRELLDSKRVRSHIEAEIGERSAAFKPYERVRAFVLIDEDFSVDNGLLTPTLKIRRDAVLDKHGARLLALYAEG
jgi:long-chain acyl-CoA synthetase